MKKAVSLVAALALLGCASTDEETTTVMKEEVKYVDVVKEGEIDTASIKAFNELSQQYPIYFAFNSDKIVNPDIIDSYAKAINKIDKNALIEVNAYCDERGSEQYNYDLGAKRALAVKEAFEAAGINNRIDTAVSHGKRDYDKSLGFAKNRKAILVASVNK
ncbi:MAG: OmpA family protein [Rickettsiales bacterium]|nr:OmpA family protein [Rickettsiales bacterium]